MELANVTRVIVETTPSFQQRVTETLIQMGAVMRRVSRCIMEPHAASGAAHFQPKGVIIEAVVNRTETSSIVQALSNVGANGEAITISIAEEFSSDTDRLQRESESHTTTREEKWGDYIITI